MGRLGIDLKWMKVANFWPPFLASGIRIARLDPEIRTVEVELRERPWTRNYVGTHFGGSLYAMCDPFYMLILLHHLGRDYIVWDKAASIRFKKPGKGTVRAVFHIPEERVLEIREALETQEKVEPVFHATVTDASGETVAEVEKLLYVRKKKPKEGA